MDLTRRQFGALATGSLAGLMNSGSAEAAAAPNFASLRQRYRVLQQAIQTALDKNIDVIRFNGRRVFTSGIFCAIAESAYVANRIKTKYPWLGSLSYLIAAAQMIVQRGGDPVAGVFVSNMPRLGGNLRLPSGSIIDDGLFEMATLAGGRVPTEWCGRLSHRPHDGRSGRDAPDQPPPRHGDGWPRFAGSGADNALQASPILNTFTT